MLDMIVMKIPLNAAYMCFLCIYFLGSFRDVSWCDFLKISTK